MALPEQTTPMTITAFEAFLAAPEHAARRYELIDGEISEKVPTEEHSLIAGNLYAALRAFVKAGDLGRVACEVRRRMPDDDYNARLPDVEFTSKARLLPVVREGAVPQMPDFAVKIQSPGQSPILLRERAIYYLKHGSRVVWLVFPGKRLVEVHTEEAIRTVTADGTLDGGDWLPEFSLPVADIFDLE